MATVLGNVYESPLLYHFVWMTLTLPEFDGHNHWTSDMVMGAHIGTLIGHEITEEHNNQTMLPPPKEGDITIKPVVNYGLAGLNIRYHL